VDLSRAGVVVLVATGWLTGALTTLVVRDMLELSCAVAIVIGARRNRSSDTSAWYALAAGLAALAIGDLIWDLGVGDGAASGPMVNLTDIVYLAAYPCLLIGLLRLAGARTRGGDRTALADGVIISVAAFIPAWQYLIEPTLRSGPTTFDAFVALAFPLLDLVLLGALLRLLLAHGVRTRAAWFLTLGVVITLVANVAYVRLVPGSTQPQWLDYLWPVSYLFIAAAAIDPSMVFLSRAQCPEGRARYRARVALLGSALFVGPAVVVVASIEGERVDPWVFGLVSALVAALVMWRIVQLNSVTAKAHEAVQESEKRLRSLVQYANDPIVVVDARGVLRYVSPAIRRILGYDPEHFCDTLVSDHVHPDDVAAVVNVLVDALDEPGRTLTFTARGQHREGEWRWIETTCTNHLGEPGIGGIVGNLRDVTERVRAAALQAGESRVIELIARQSSLDVVLSELITTFESQLLDGRASIRLLDATTTKLSGAVAPTLPADFVHSLDQMADEHGLPPTEIIGQAGPHVITDIADSERVGPLAALAAIHGVKSVWMMAILTADANRLLGTFTVYGSSVREPTAGELAVTARAAALAAVAIDRADAEDRLEHQAMHDPLTGLPNRSLALDRLGQALLGLDRKGSSVAALFLDLDRFKGINDSLGHDAGDEVLVEVARRLTNVMRAGDTVARFGGDEFVVVCEGVDNMRAVMLAAERITEALAEPFPVARGEVNVLTASIGIAMSQAPTDRAESLLRDADAAMYQAKARGGATTQLFDDALRSQVVVRLETERALRRALDRDELEVYYQPQVRVGDGGIVAAEALVRWNHPRKGLIGPAEFIGVAEETGLILPLGKHVLNTACRQLASWRRAGFVPPGFVMSVNLSGRQLFRQDFAATVCTALETAGIAPASICLEVTESVLVDDVDGTAAALLLLKDVGVRLAIDDFGTGYSSLAYLKRFPFDQLKIDRRFVEGLGHDAPDEAIVAATIQMAHALGMKVVAEGVEEVEQLTVLTQRGCDLAQGYYFARPAPADEFAGLNVEPAFLRLA
jgi:diguanylate cyclase (GGDEF)-like protein/PAS domain S-box-containing protein